MAYRMIFEDGSEAYLMHYGIKGMKWGVWNAETRAKYAGGIKEAGKSLAESAKKGLKGSLGSAAVAGITTTLGTGLPAAGVVAAANTFAKAYVGEIVAQNGAKLIDKALNKTKIGQKIPEQLKTGVYGAVDLGMHLSAIRSGQMFVYTKTGTELVQQLITAEALTHPMDESIAPFMADNSGHGSTPAHAHNTHSSTPPNGGISAQLTEAAANSPIADHTGSSHAHNTHSSTPPNGGISAQLTEAAANSPLANSSKSNLPIIPSHYYPNGENPTHPHPGSHSSTPPNGGISAQLAEAAANSSLANPTDVAAMNFEKAKDAVLRVAGVVAAPAAVGVAAGKAAEKAIDRGDKKRNRKK